MKRYWELDSARGIAVILMVFYHALFDIRYFGFVELGFPAGFWWIAPWCIASLFLLLVGISLSISRARAKGELSAQQIRKKYLFRGLKIFALGLLVTAATWLYPREGFIQFGILHLIGLSIILAIPLLKFKKASLALGAALIAVGIFLYGLKFSFPWLLWLGFIPRGFYSLDYYPLLPWFGVVLIGLFIGKSIYPNGRRGFAVREMPKKKPFSFLSFIGRNALAVYLIHQPAIVALLFLFFGFP